MAIITKKGRTMTGSATNTLGTLGRSIFNSTIGTFADKDVMDQLYGAMYRLNSPIETIDKTFDNDAFNGRNNVESVYTLLSGLDIKSSSDFMNKNREFMKRLMNLNKNEKDITLNSLGVDAIRDTHLVRNEYIGNYDYVSGNNYYEEFVKPLMANQQIGDETTVLQLESNTNFNYGGIHNDLYTVDKNLYPDDENKGTYSNKWIVENRNSLMYKTKKLFNSNKVNTIISRFHTNPNRPKSLLDNASSKYGLSHGRNLLTKEAEDGYNSNYANGYDNPYCRVWTHHHQYDRYYKTIRPFSHTDSQGNYTDTVSVKDFHRWNNFSDSKDKTTGGNWGWKKEENNGWQYSVLQDNGKVNITPKFVNGGASNIHTKQCMFSIENLAWKGYDPYSFEQALSWEQRGPLGGRIMWFPPYGIQFQETTTAKWQENTFLGRGEDVYTYTNTARTGTLNFMMVVDHPSIVDYVTWTNENKNVTDTDILRFFAGCGEGDGNGLRDFAKPTPLTDEYKQANVEPKDAIEDNGNANIVNQNTVEQTTTEEDEKATEDSITFYVFYPNNYSGTYDDENGDGHRKDGRSLVEAIPYLIAGNGAQKYSGDFSDGSFANDIPLNSENADDNNTGNGYEMIDEGLGGYENSYISGTSAYPNKGENNYWSNVNSNNKYSVVSKNLKKWYYRIDGRYNFPKDDEKKLNYYNQILSSPSSYIDESSYQLNKNINSLISTGIDENMDKNNIYTLAEIAYVLYEGKNDFLMNRCNTEDNKRLSELKKRLSREIKSVKGIGCASAQGYEDLNEILGRHRAQTAANWFIRCKGLNNISPEISVDKRDTSIKKSDKDNFNGKFMSGDESELNSKKWRYAKVIITFETVGKSSPSTSDEKKNTESIKKEIKFEVPAIGEKKYVGYNPTGEKKTFNRHECDVYLDLNGKKWILDGEKFYSMEYVMEEDITPKARYGSESSDENRVRYDQEYHFFKVLQQTDPFVYGSLMDKLQYFDPAFHSMTPEGFNGRLTFLQQCMRQGNTVSASDGRYSKSANNLAFGRAPYCVLRLGDFYNQMIVIDNLSITYDPLVWDLNIDGIGVQPLIANVSISFKFIGGGDLTGPVRRLQNAMSFNYYANARLYDNRADRVERMWSDKTCGAIENEEILKEETNDKRKETYNMDETSSFYTTKMYK